jgi:flagellar biosynthesis/type III secretory pathway chaperone
MDDASGMGGRAVDRMQEQLTTLEDLLVRQFRACQSLHMLTKEERLALSSSGAADALLGLVEQKEALLDELGKLEDRRRMLVQEVSGLLGLQAAPLSLADVLAALPEDISGRLGRLREGILALLGGVRDLTHGNRALAETALERADAVQAFLLNLCRPAPGYRPPGLPPAPQSSVAWDLDQKV